MARVLIVVHSRTGHCRRLARSLAEARRWTLAEDDYLDGGADYGRCALDALLRRRPRIRYGGPNPATFDAVVLVSPVWCWRLSPPMRGFVRDMRGKLTNVGVVSCMGGSGAGNALAEVERLVGRRAIGHVAFRQSEVEAGRYVEALKAFADAVEAGAARAHSGADPELRPAG